MNNVFLILTNKNIDDIVELVREIQLATPHLGTVIILKHANEYASNSIDAANEIIEYFDDRILTSSTYIPITFGLVPGNNHFPLLNYYQKHPFFDYYWVIEDDVRFSGDWKILFQTLAVEKADFISTHIHTAQQQPKWFWWSTLANPYQVIAFEDRIKSFNPIYRISSRALAFIHQSLIQYWCGHHEVLIPTLLHQAGYTIMDMGGDGLFTPEHLKNLFYDEISTNEEGSILEGTMRHRPVILEMKNQTNKLYHPVKM